MMTSFLMRRVSKQRKSCQFQFNKRQASSTILSPKSTQLFPSTLEKPRLVKYSKSSKKIINLIFNDQQTITQMSIASGNNSSINAPWKSQMWRDYEIPTVPISVLMVVIPLFPLAWMVLSTEAIMLQNHKCNAEVVFNLHAT